MLPGYFSVKKRLIGENTLRELSAIHINFIYPCLILSLLISSFDFKELSSLWYLPGICFGIMLLGFLVGKIFLQFPLFSDTEERKAFLLQCTINNYSFLPLPIAYCLYGEKGTAIIIYSSIGAETALWTLGVGALRGEIFNKSQLRKFLAPPLIALYLALLLIAISGLLSFNLKSFISSDKIFSPILFSIKTLGSATVPIAMVVCGARLAFMPLRELNKLSLWTVITLRLIVIPFLAIFAIYFLPIDLLYKNTLCIVAVMPVAVASILLSEIYGGDKDFIAASVFLTHAFSLITVPLILAIYTILTKI